MKTSRAPGRPRVRRKTCSSRSRWPTSSGRPICSSQPSPARTASTAGSRWKSRPCSRTTPKAPWRPPAIEASIFAGVPVNVTLLFSAEQYVGAADAYWRGIERRIAAGLDPAVASVASLFVSRWDVAVKDKAPTELRNRLGIAVAQRTYKVYRERLASDRSYRLANAGARPQRLLWASTGTKDPAASDTLYIEALAAPFTINTMPEGTL